MSEGFSWTESNVEILREKFASDGPKKIAALLGTTPAAVSLKARRMKIDSGRPRKEDYKWTDKMDDLLVKMYPTASRKELEEAFNLPNHAIRTRARRLNLFSTVRAELGGKTRSEKSASCNYRFFDEWNRDSAYVMGFLYADGSITKRECEIVAAVAESDIQVLEYINRVTCNQRKIWFREPYTDNRGHNHNRSAWMTLANKILVRKAMDLGLKPRKTYGDYLMPRMPKEYTPDFIRGYFDGDGTAFVSKQGYPRVGLIGTPLFISHIRNTLVRQAGMKYQIVRKTVGKTTTWAKVWWGAKDDVQRFVRYVYQDGYPFCLERKKVVLDKWLENH